MIIEFTVQELMIFVVCTLTIAAGLLLLPILWNIKKIVHILRTMIETHQGPINKALVTVPEIAESVRKISGNIKETTDRLKTSVPVILQEVEAAAKATTGSVEAVGAVIGDLGFDANGAFASARKETSGVMAYFPLIDDILQIIYHILSAKK